jgi:hypothetical protein
VNLTEQDVLDALERIKDVGSIPLRENSWNEYPFWADPINLTKARPVPANSGWLNYIVLPRRSQYIGIVRQFVGTSQNAPDVSGVEYRFIKRGVLLPINEYNITNDVEKHLDRNQSNPFPTHPRHTFIRVEDDEDLILQVRNTSGSVQLAFAALYGWYYDDLRSPDERSPTEGITDVSSFTF